MPLQSISATAFLLLINKLYKVFFLVYALVNLLKAL
jgi:hypothetical protein